MNDVSQITGIPANRIYKWEKGTKPNDAEDLLKIKSYLKGELETIPKADLKTSEDSGVPSVGDQLTIELAIKREREAVDRERKALEEDMAFLRELIRSNLTVVMTTLMTIRFRQEAAGDAILSSLERIEVKSEGELIEDADKRLNQIEQEWQKRDSAAAQGR